MLIKPVFSKTPINIEKTSTIAHIEAAAPAPSLTLRIKESAIDTVFISERISQECIFFSVFLAYNPVTNIIISAEISWLTYRSTPEAGEPISRHPIAVIINAGPGQTQ